MVVEFISAIAAVSVALISNVYVSTTASEAATAVLNAY